MQAFMQTFSRPGVYVSKTWKVRSKETLSQEMLCSLLFRI